MPLLILTVVGPDRPGLVRALSETVAARGGSWLESRMVRLAGQFAGVVLVDAPEALLDDLHALESQGLRIAAQSGVVETGVAQRGMVDSGFAQSGVVEIGVAQTAFAGSGVIATRQSRLTLEVVGNDRPGIVRDVARVLADSGVNIEELTTGVASGSFSGETLFRATALLRAPNAAAVDAVRQGLEQLGNELMVDIRPADEA